MAPPGGISGIAVWLRRPFRRRDTGPLSEQLATHARALDTSVPSLLCRHCSGRRYLAPGQEYIAMHDAREQLPVSPAPGKALAFLFFPVNEQYREMIRERYPAGRAGEVRNPLGRLVFYTYLVPPEVVPNGQH